MVRSSLGGAALSSTSARYPMYVIPVKTLLELQQWEPHQNLLAKGKLVEVTPEVDLEIVFVSHQWTSFEHPDPTGEQLARLQAVLRQLMAGQTSVMGNPQLQVIYSSTFETKGEQWAATLPKVCVWFDYVSIPQPGAVDDAATADAAPSVKKMPSLKKMATSDHRVIDAAATAAVESSSSHASHTEGAAARKAELVRQLVDAVDSIPSYVERSAQMWVLVPPTAHNSVADGVCNFASWRSRGWCRMEFAAAKLACGDEMPVMIIEGAAKPLVYFNPCDTFKLRSSRGAFSVDDDRTVVNKTLASMLRAKAASFAALGDVTLSRLVFVFRPVFVDAEYVDALDADTPATAGTPEYGAVAASGEYKPAAETAVERLKRRLAWRSDAEEAAWEKETGFNLLTLAAALDDTAAVSELIAGDDAAALLAARGVKMVLTKGCAPHRRQPFSQLFCGYGEGMTPLVAAMTLGSPATVGALLDGGADPQRDASKLFGDAPCHFRGSILAGNVETTRYFLQRYPQYVNKPVVNGSGTTPLHLATWTSACQRQAEMIRTLLDLGAAGSLDTQQMFWGTPLMNLACRDDADPESFELLVGAGASIDQRAKMSGMMKMMKAMSAVGAFFGSVKMRGLRTMINTRTFAPGNFATTPLHVAAERGDVEACTSMCQCALRGGGDLDELTARLDRKRVSPLDLSAKAGGGSNAAVAQVLEKVLKGSGVRAV